MSKPKCPATDTEASLRIQVIKKRLQRVDSLLIEPLKVLKMFCWKHRVKECVCKILKGEVGQTRCIMGDVQMVNSHTSQYFLVPDLSLANHKISNGSQRNNVLHPSIYKVSDVYLDITTIIKLKVRDPCKRVRMTRKTFYDICPSCMFIGMFIAQSVQSPVLVPLGK